jgi:hypothetical protein
MDRRIPLSGLQSTTGLLSATTNAGSWSYCASKEDIRTVVSQELEKNIPTKKEIAALVEQEVARLSPTNKESVYSIVTKN